MTREEVFESLRRRDPNVYENMVEWYDFGNVYNIVTKNGRTYDYFFESNYLMLCSGGESGLSPKEAYDHSFGKRLRSIMQSKGLGQYALSKRSGISQPMLSNYMNGKTSPSIYAVYKLVEALDCSFDDLMPRE